MNLEEVFAKVVFLLGAGASAGADCKLSAQMLTLLKTSINNLNPTDDPDFHTYKKDFSEIYTFILASLHYQNTLRGLAPESSINIEDFVMVLNQLRDKEFIIPYPLIGNWNDKISKWEMRTEDVFSWLKQFVTQQLIRSWTVFSPDKAKEMLRPIKELLAEPEDIKANFFSLNYDLVFEKSFNSAQETLLDNGFSDRLVGETTRKYWAAAYNDLHSPAKINLYKLHGSVDWEYDETSEAVMVKEDIIDGRDPFIIFGSFFKMLSFDPFLYVLSEFRKLLTQATIFVVIGYSFHDKYINNLLIQQLSNDTDRGMPKKLLVVDTGNKGKTEEQFTDELRAIQESKSVNDVINFKLISPDRVKLLPITAAEFYQKYFANRAELFANELETIERGEKTF